MILFKYQNSKKLVIFIIYLSVIALFSYILFSHAFSLDDLRSIEKIKNIYRQTSFDISNNNIYIFFYIVFYFTYIFFAGFPIVFTLLTIIIFNPIASIFINIFCISFGGLLFYLFIAKIFPLDTNFYNFVLKKYKILKLIKKNGIVFVFLFRFLAGSSPFLMQNLILYTFKVTIKDFLVGTSLSVGLSVTVLAFFGKSLINFLLSII